MGECTEVLSFKLIPSNMNMVHEALNNLAIKKFDVPSYRTVMSHMGGWIEFQYFEGDEILIGFKEEV